MRIGLISDTHIPEAGRDLWPQVYDAFLGINPAGPKVDLILHAGDMHVTDVLDWLAEGGGGPVPACPCSPETCSAASGQSPSSTSKTGASTPGSTSSLRANTDQGPVPAGR